MKLMELVSPNQSPPRKEEKKRRLAIAKNIINMLIKAKPNDVKHSNVFVLADKAAGKRLNIDGLELQRNEILRNTKTTMIANSPLNIVKLHSIQKQMEKILKGS